MAYSAVTSLERLFSELNRVPGTIVSAAVESIQVFHFSGRLNSLAVAVGETHPWTDRWRAMGIPVFMPSRRTGDPTPVNTSQFLRNPETLAFLNTLKAPVRIMMFKPDAASHEFLTSHGFEVIGCDPGRARRLENKMHFPKIAARAELPLPPHHIVRIPARPDRSSTIMPPDTLPLICQFAKGFSGNRTFLIRSSRDWTAVCRHFPGRKVRISPYLAGDTWTANGCVMPDQTVIVSEPFLQETHVYLPDAVDQLPHRVGSRGNAWGQNPPEIIQPVTDAMHRLGRALHELHYRGFFGADLLAPLPGQNIGHGDMTLLGIEINPRITASASILTPLEMQIGTLPIMACHLAASLDLPGVITPGHPAEASLPPGGQWIIRNTPPDSEWIGAVQPGTYSMNTAVPVEKDSLPEHLENGECLVWKPAPQTASAEHGRLIYRGRSSQFYHFLELLRKRR
ncbi:MAG TPA: hypothetical protein PLV45_04865 [bacterium]|nr:hypothetical protein [bacterium]